jgi:hypothetical protein
MNFAKAVRTMTAVAGIHQKLVDDIPQLKRGIVWCVKCGRSQSVNAAGCLAKGWPKCCDQTMTIDSPEERAAAKRRVEL